MKRFISGVVLLIIVPVYGQYSVSGTVFGADQKPLEGAHIHLAEKSLTTQQNGQYTFYAVSKGIHRVYVTYIGYVRKDTLVDVQQNMQLNVQLQRESMALDEVVIKGSSHLNKSVVTEVKVKNADLQRNISRSLADVLTELPGVSILKTGSTISKPIVQGLHSSRVPIFFGGIRMEDQQWGVEHAPNFDINAAGKVSLIKGAGALQFSGDAIGGLIILEPQTVVKDTLFGNTALNYNTNGRGGAFNAAVHRGNFCDWAWNVQTSYSYFGDREAPDYILSNSGSRTFNFYSDFKHIGRKIEWGGAASFYRSELAILRSSHVGNITDLYYSIASGQPNYIADFGYAIQSPKQEVQHVVGKLFLNQKIGTSATWNTQYEFQFNQRYEYDIRRGATRDTPSLDLKLFTHSLLSDYKIQKGQSVLKTGIVGQFQHNFANPETGIRALIPTYDKLDLGGYFIWQQKFSTKWQFEMGLRYDFSTITAQKFYLKSRWNERGYSPMYDYFITADAGTQWQTQPKFTYHNLSGSVGLRYVVSDAFDFIFTMGRSVRNPNPSELFSDGLHHSTGMIELGDLNLVQEKALKFSLEMNYRHSRWTMQTIPFLSNIQDFMYLRPIGFETTIRGAFPVWEYQRTHALLTGLDGSIGYQISKAFQYTIQGSWVYAQDKTKNEPLIDIPPFNLTQHLIFEKKAWHQFQTRLSGQWVEQQHRFPNTNVATNIVVNNQLVPVEVDLSTPPNSYFLWDWFAEITLGNPLKTHWVLGLGVQNIGNIAYRNYLNRQRFFADELGRNVLLQIRYNF
jgi:iron complex outermembrane receptor protein